MATANIAASSGQQQARIFLSYKRHAEPDESVAAQIVEGLTSASHLVFVDRLIQPSEYWAQRIEQEVRQADWLIVFLSELSSRSEMVRGEVEIARAQASSTGGRPRIIPVRLSFNAPLPYPLNAYLDQIQQATWNGEADTSGLLSVLKRVIAGQPIVSDGEAGRSASFQSAIPAYAAQLLPPGGTLDVEDPIYIIRRSEQKAVSVLDFPGQTIVIKGPRQIGKSSFLNRLALAATQRGRTLALLDFQLFDEATKDKPQRFFAHFMRLICETMQKEYRRSGSFSDAGGYIYECTVQMEQLILSEKRSVLLAIDEADRLLTASFRRDFFAMLRYWHDLRANPARRQTWRNLDLALVTATEPYLLIDPTDQSPFNVGHVCRLEDFGPEEIAEMNRLHSNVLGDSGQAEMLNLFGGQPYLTRRAFYEILHGPRGTTPTTIFEESVGGEGPFREHLRYHCLNLIRNPELAAAFAVIVQGNNLDDEDLFHRIEGAGLVKRQGGREAPRCRLYAEYFRRHLRTL